MPFAHSIFGYATVTLEEHLLLLLNRLPLELKALLPSVLDNLRKTWALLSDVSYHTLHFEQGLKQLMWNVAGILPLKALLMCVTAWVVAVSPSSTRLISSSLPCV